MVTISRELKMYVTCITKINSTDNHIWRGEEERFNGHSFETVSLATSCRNTIIH